jgi:D-erythro-7,8-dihydroneopterin triphosphate epimerase
MFLIKIKNLHVITFIGFNPEELIHQQEVIINLEIRVAIPGEVLEKDEPEGIYNYKTITKKVIAYVQDGRFKLLEVLTRKVLDLVLADPLVSWARVEIDKPRALRSAESVSVVMESAR